MLVYLAVFGISCLLFKVSYKTNKKEFLTIIIAILIPCILAGIRATSIGTDVEVYILQLFNCAQKSKSFSEYYSMNWFVEWRYKYVADFEIGFSGLIYIITKLTNNIQWILFFIQLFITIPIYLGLKKFKSLEDKIWLSMLVFYCMFYNISLNIMRQFIAIAILFYGMSCIVNEEKSNLKFFIAWSISILFHKSSIMGILIYIIYYILNHDYKRNRIIKLSQFRISANKFLSLTIIIFSIFLVLNSNLVFEMLSLLGLEQYKVYIDGEIEVLFSKIIKVLPIIFIFSIVYKNFMRIHKDAWFYILMYLLGSIILTQFASVNLYAERIGYLFQIFNIVSFPLLCNSAIKKENNTLNKIILVCYLIFYWYYTFVHCGANQTVPYLSYWE